MARTLTSAAPSLTQPLRGRPAPTHLSGVLQLDGKHVLDIVGFEGGPLPDAFGVAHPYPGALRTQVTAQSLV